MRGTLAPGEARETGPASSPEICVARLGVTALPSARTNPKAVTESVFESLAATGAFTRPGLALICMGPGCLAVAALRPEDRR
jgi:hypothetical protein